MVSETQIENFLKKGLDKDFLQIGAFFPFYIAVYAYSAIGFTKRFIRLHFRGRKIENLNFV